MKSGRRRLIPGMSGAIAAAVMTLVVLGAASASFDASAQSADRLTPPRVNESDDPPTIRLYLVAALLGALVVGANMIPSKRGHQD